MVKRKKQRKGGAGPIAPSFRANAQGQQSLLISSLLYSRSYRADAGYCRRWYAALSSLYSKKGMKFLRNKAVYLSLGFIN
jgi:hypothetical protein